MSKKMFQVLSLLVCILLAATAFSGCQSNAPASTAPAATAAATASAATAAPTATPEPTATPLKEVTLRFFFPGDPPPMMADVWKAVSDQTKAQLNASFEINFVGWSDYPQKMQLLTASGDNYDANYDADWFNYGSMVNKGAYLDLTDLMPKYAPTLYEAYKKMNYLTAISVGGKIYGVPWVNTKSSRPVFVYRSDLLSKFGLSSSEDFSTVEGMEKYLYAAKKADPNVYPITWGTSDPGPILWSLYAKYEMARWDFHNFTFSLNDAACKIVPIEQTDMFREVVKLTKKWLDDGIIPKDMIALKQAPSFDNGEEYAFLHIYEGAIKNETFTVSGATKGSAIMYPDKKYIFDSPMNNAMVINKNAANPERALMFFDLITTNRDVYDTVIYGIQGKTYVLNGQKAELPAGADAKQPQYMGWSGQWGMWRSSFFRPDNTMDEAFWTKMNQMLAMPTNVVSPLAGFIPDTTAIKTEIAQRDALYDELGKLLAFGTVDDVDKSLDEYIQKQKDAGVDKITAELQKQVDAFLASKK